MTPPTIAVVEDNWDNRQLLRALLDDRYDVREYESGVQALAGIEAERPDLVLLDISLPEMDGLEVLAALRANDSLRGLPVVALTAHAMSGDRERLLEAGFDEYVSKPIVEEEILYDAIERLLGRSARD